MEKENRTRLFATTVVFLLLIPVLMFAVQGEEQRTNSSTSSVQNLFNDALNRLPSSIKNKCLILRLLELLNRLFESLYGSEETGAYTSSSNTSNSQSNNDPEGLPSNENDTDEVKDPPPDANVTDKENYLENHAQVRDRNQSNYSYVYPRLSLGTFQLQKWLLNPDYGLNWLYQFQNIYTSTDAQKIIEIKQQAINAGRRDWVENCTFIEGTLCLWDAKDYETRPPNWVYLLASYMSQYAIDIAIYENKLLGCDWFMRDIYGDKIKLWKNNESWAIDTSPDCGLGLWDGTYTLDNVQYYIGDTRGKTFNEWLVSMKEPVMLNSIWKDAYEGIQSDDAPSAWLYTFNGQIPDPKHDGIGMTYNELQTYCIDSWEYAMTGFFGELAQQGYITRFNGNNLRWYYEGWHNPYEYHFDCFTSCKMEDYGKWGGWPWSNTSLHVWAYKMIEQMFHPLSCNPEDPQYDHLQGWDTTTLQVNAWYSWSSYQIDKWKRMGLANCLLGDGYFDGYAYREDYFFNNFLNHGQTQFAPRGIPQMSFTLGTACGDYAVYYDPLYQTKPLYYRQFYNVDTGKNYTVVSNPHWQTINGIPWHDGVWFEGEWPYGIFTPVIFE